MMDEFQKEQHENAFNEWWYALPDEAPSDPRELARLAFFTGAAYATRDDDGPTAEDLS